MNVDLKQTILRNLREKKKERTRRSLPSNKESLNLSTGFHYCSWSYIFSDYFLSLQLISTNFFVERDINIIGVRYSDRDTRNTVILFARNRFPFRQKWRIGPRISLEQTNITSNNSELFRYSLSAKVDYRLVKWANFEMEAGYDSYDYTGGNIPDYTRIYTILGYYVDF